MTPVTSSENLLGIPPTHLPDDPAATRLEQGVAADQVAAGGVPRVTTIQLRVPRGTPSVTGWIGRSLVAGTSSGRRTVTIVPSGSSKRRASTLLSVAMRARRSTASSTVHVALT